MSLFKKIKDAFGVNLKAVDCPSCGTTQPKRRKPKNMQQALWGGSTCENCTCEMDK